MQTFISNAQFMHNTWSSNCKCFVADRGKEEKGEGKEEGEEEGEEK